MNIYSIFDDFPIQACNILKENGHNITLHPSGFPRPNSEQLKRILNSYDCIIIGTSQIITEEMFDDVVTSKIIATASIGVDHIHIPITKKGLITIINAPQSNAQSVAEFVFACILLCQKRILEGNNLYKSNKNKTFLSKKPQEISGKTIGLIGAGNISKNIMRIANVFNMNVIVYTKTPNKHKDFYALGATFVNLETLCSSADIISLALPYNDKTKGIINKDLIDNIKNDAVFISISRLGLIDFDALFKKTQEYSSFYACLDVDLDNHILSENIDSFNLIITPHIAGGTEQARTRMFFDLSKQLIKVTEAF